MRRCPMRTRGWPIRGPATTTITTKTRPEPCTPSPCRILDVLSQPDAVPLPDVARPLRPRRPPRTDPAQAGRRAGTVLARFRFALRPRWRSACRTASAMRSGSPSAARTSCCRRSVVNDLLPSKLAEIEQKEGRKPGGRTRKRLKEDLVHELLPRAFVRPSRTDALLDLEHGLCIVDTSSPQDRRERRRAKSAMRSAASRRCR